MCEPCGYLLMEDGIAVNDAFCLAVTAITAPRFDEVINFIFPEERKHHGAGMGFAAEKPAHMRPTTQTK